MSATPAWELAKENAAPLQRGRNVSDLERAARGGSGSGGSSTLRPRTQETKERIEHFERLVQPSEAPHITEVQDGEDPLQNWLAYIKFYQNSFPSDTHQQFLLMERCTRALVKMTHYANDERFISVCAKYADKTKEPAQVFKYLHQQKIGSKTALFWVAWAFVAEKQNDFPFAEQIYKKGISKDAQPLNILKVRHKQFQRRMSRLWLNNSQQNDQLDEYDEGEEEVQRRSRNALGGLSQDRIRRNDRGQRGLSTSRMEGRRMAPSIPQARSGMRTGSSGSHMTPQGFNRNDNSGFAIYVENEGENAVNVLDDPSGNHKRVIERDADRRKENTLDAERWNERDGLISHRSSHAQPPAPRCPPPPFAVFVDEECEAQHEREREERRKQTERHREIRDERTFRERSDKGMAEKLARDPLRYVKDHSQLDTDLAAEIQEKPQTKEKETLTSNADKRSRIGFNKRLLKDTNGIEQSFEEARAIGHFFTTAPPSVNFNLLHTVHADQSSQMECDEGNSTDVSMADSSSGQSAASQPRKISKMDSDVGGRVLFRNETSYDGSLNQTGLSTASSTVNNAEAVGVPTKREEETINTKLAVRELSMMFSSPAFGVDNVARRTERQAVLMNQSIEEGTEDRSFANIGEGLGNSSMLDNSILNYNGDEATENRGPRNPLARTTKTPGFEKMALQEVKCDESSDGILSCSRSRRLQFPQRQHHEQIVDSLDDAGFSVYEDHDNQQTLAEDEPMHPFAHENDDERNASVSLSSIAPKGGFAIFEDEDTENQKPVGNPGLGFTIYEDDNSQTDSDDAHEEVGPENGDTATLSLFGETVGLLKTDLAHSSDDEGNESRNEDGATATLSLFNEVFQDLSATQDTPRASQETPKGNGGFSIFVDNDDNNSNVQEEASIVTKNKCSIVEYEPTHEHDTKMSLRRLQSSSSVASNSRAPLPSLLSTRGKCFHLPHVVLPREFSSKHITANTQICVGKHTGVISKELGRGGYGVVALMETEKNCDQTNTIAIKVQSPTDCLAWECEILRRLEKRAKKSDEKDESYPFPRPLTFVSLADGSILSMTAGSKSGLNLVDLVNIYKVKLAEPVPELVALHYTSRLLSHIERLHWHGKILHCDCKPDNVVLSTLNCPDNACRDIECSDLMLVDFGRAVDLEGATNAQNSRSVLFRSADNSGDDTKCVAIREGKPWSYDIDTFGVLACAHVLLFGTHIRIRKGKDDRWSLANPLKRYWHKALWENCFNTLLNLDDDSGLAIGSRPRSVRALRTEIDEYLLQEMAKLRSLMSRQLTLLPPSRDKLKP